MTVLLLFQFWFLLFFSSLNAIARTSKTMLSKSGKSEHPCLFPYPRGMLSIFHLWIWCYNMTFIMLRCVPFMPTFWRVFIIFWCWTLSKIFSSSIEMIIWFLFFSFLMWCITLTDLQILRNLLYPWNKYYLIMIYDPLNALFKSVR